MMPNLPEKYSYSRAYFIWQYEGTFSEHGLKESSSILRLNACFEHT